MFERTDTVHHLEFVAVRAPAGPPDQFLGDGDQPWVMRGDQRYRLAAHQCPQSTHESQIDLMWPAKTDLPGFAVGTLAETNPVAGQGQGGQIAGGALQGSLQGDAGTGQVLVDLVPDAQGRLDAVVTRHVHDHPGARVVCRPADPPARRLRTGPAIGP